MKSAVDESCLDIYTAKLNSRLATFGCHQQGRNQFFGFVKNGQIVTAEELCVGTPHIEMSSSSMPVVLVECSEHDLFQFWKYDSKVLKSLNFLFFILEKSLICSIFTGNVAFTNTNWLLFEK